MEWLHGITGLSDMNPWLAWAGVPVLIALAAGFGEAQSRRWAWFGDAVFWALVVALGLRLGRHATAHWDVPVWLWIAALVVLPFRMHPPHQRLVLVSWLFVACGCLTLLLQLWQWARPANDALMAFGLAGWVLCALLHWVWPRHRAPKPPPQTPPPAPVAEDALQARLGSDDAQEGADKYTRE